MNNEEDEEMYRGEGADEPEALNLQMVQTTAEHHGAEEEDDDELLCIQK